MRGRRGSRLGTGGERGIVGDDVDHAAERMVAVEHALRPLDHLDARDGADGNLEPVYAAHVGRVEPLAVAQHQRAAVGVLAEAPQGDLGLGGVATQRAYRHTGEALQGIDDMLHALVAQLLPTDDGDLGGHLLRRAFGAGGRDDDRRRLIEIGGRRGLRQGVGDHRQRDGERQCAAQVHGTKIEQRRREVNPADGPPMVGVLDW